MSRFGDKSYATCGPGCGCDDDQLIEADSTESAFSMPESESEDDCR